MSDLDDDEVKATRELNGVDIKEYKINVTKKQSLNILKNVLNKFEIRGEELYLLKEAIRNILVEREQDKARMKELREYINIAPNLDEMTATKYSSIQQEAYIRGRAEEQQRAEQIIYENYIPKQKVKDRIEELKKIRIGLPVQHMKVAQIKILEELLEDK